MNLKTIIGMQHLRAGRAFGLLAALFVCSFGLMVILVVLDQQRVLESTSHLQTQTVPEIIRYQRLARNLEQLRQEGERIFAVSTPQARQQAMFVVLLITSHPSVLEHPAAAALAHETEHFLGDVLHRSATEPAIFTTYHEEWERLTARLSVLIDDISIQGINLASNDLNEVARAMSLARDKQSAALVLVGVFLLVFFILLRRHLIYPLQLIDRALSSLSVEHPAPVFAPAVMHEIHVIEDAIGELHASLLNNEKARFTLQELANKDGLTGLINRRHFQLSANAEVQRAQRYSRPVTVGMADIDYFKKLNDTYGHAAGDLVLRELAGIMRDCFRQSDLICRYGGEEFAFLFPESTLAEAHVQVERLREQCASHDFVLADGLRVRVSLSIGLADASSGNLETALNRADDALYEAKHRGRNQVALALPAEIGWTGVLAD